MAGIQEYLDKILAEPFILNMRQAIHDGIEKAYDDATAEGNTNMEVSRARGTHPTLNDRLVNSDNKLNTSGNKISQLEAHKVDKNGNEQVTWGMLNQSVKENITGENTPIVGLDSVNTSNIVRNAVTPEKTSFIELWTNNLYNPENFIPLGYYEGGNWVSPGYQDFGSTGMIEVSVESESEWFYAPNAGRTSCFDADQNFIREASVQASYFSVPVNTRYVSIAIREARRYDFYLVQNTSVLRNTKKLDSDIIVSRDDLQDLTWNALGDSITEGPNYLGIRAYPERIAEKTGINVNNYGISGSWISYSSSNNPMVDRYEDMELDADIITVFGGVNDRSNNVAIGSWGDRENTTFYGALSLLTEGLLTRYPSKRIGFITPLQNTTNYEIDSRLTNYVDAMIDVCARHSIPVLDLYHSGGIAAGVSASASANLEDGLHPSADGQVMISRKIEAFIRQL